MKSSSVFSRIITGIFCLLLSGMTIWSIVAPDRAYSENERRALQAMPEFTLESLFTRDQDQKFTQKYEDYVADQFILRDQFVALKNQAELLIGKKDLGGVYLGEDGYLFSKETSMDQSALRSNLTFVDSFLEQARTLSSVENTAVTLIPDSGHVLSAKLPAFAPLYDFQSVNTLGKEVLGASYIDVYPTLVSHKEEYVYYKTDHHWTSLGAYYAYEALAEALDLSAHALSDYTQTAVSDNFKGTYASKINLSASPDTITRFSLCDSPAVPTMQTQEASYDSIYVEDALSTQDQYNYFLGPNQSVNRITTGIQNGKRLLVIKDSFAHSIIPFLTDHYEEIICIDLRYFRESALKLCDTESITNILVLYQATNFAKDSGLIQLSLSN